MNRVYMSPSNATPYDWEATWTARATPIAKAVAWTLGHRIPDLSLRVSTEGRASMVVNPQVIDEIRRIER